MNGTSRKQASNYKVEHFFSQLIQVYTKVFERVHNLSSEEQDASFQGHHEDKQGLAFNREGDGFLIYEVSEDGYTINFYPKNPPT